MSKKKRDIPVFKNPIIETHCHLDYLEASKLKETIQAAQAVGIEKIITIAVSPDNLQLVRDISKQNEIVFGSQGVHPHDAKKFDDSTHTAIVEGLSDDKILAVGEIGLDYFYEHTDREQQKLVFEQQLQLAVDHQYPVIIHSREADEDTQSILKNFSTSLKCKGVIHSFTSGKTLAEFCLDDGYCLGFNGISTFNKADNVREIIELTPLDKILLETDAPYLTPAPYRGRENAPCYLPFIAEQVALSKNIEIETLLEQCHINSEQLFFKQK